MPRKGLYPIKVDIEFNLYVSGAEGSIATDITMYENWLPFLDHPWQLNDWSLSANLRLRPRRDPIVLKLVMKLFNFFLIFFVK